METREVTMKKCSRCGRELPIDQFYKKVKSVDGHQAYCKDCARESVYKMLATKKGVECKTTFKTDAVPTVVPKGVVDSNKVVEKRILDGISHKVYSNADLAKFTPRELIEELRARGYSGKLTYTMEVVL